MRKIIYGVISAAFLIAAPAHAETYNLTVAGASPGGLWSAIGAALDKTINTAYPGSTVTYQTGSGGLANAKLVQDKKVPMGIAADMELNAAVKGAGPFRGRPQKDLRTLVRVYSPSDRFQYLYVLVNGDVAEQYGIKTMADLKANAKNIRIGFNRPGNMDGDIGIAAIEANDIDTDSFRQVVRAASKELTSLLLDRRLDAAAWSVSYNHSTIQELERGIPLVQLNVGEKAAAEVAEEFGIKPCTIKANEHRFINEDKVSVCTGGLVMVHKDMDEQIAYDLAKAMLKEIEVFKATHRAFKNATPESLAEPAAAPHHPGAAKAYKEAGVL
jgi:TRAP transporter TAXI family solute receptor